MHPCPQDGVLGDVGGLVATAGAIVGVTGGFVGASGRLVDTPGGFVGAVGVLVDVTGRIVGATGGTYGTGEVGLVVSALTGAEVGDDGGGVFDVVWSVPTMLLWTIDNTF